MVVPARVFEGVEVGAGFEGRGEGPAEAGGFWGELEWGSEGGGQGAAHASR